MKVKKVIFSDEDLKEKFDELGDNDPIKKALVRVIGHLKEDAFAGRLVKKELIPEKYKGHKNLLIYNLPSVWRMLYTVKTKDELEIISVILNWMSHKDYERLFKF